MASVVRAQVQTAIRGWKKLEKQIERKKFNALRQQAALTRSIMRRNTLGRPSKRKPPAPEGSPPVPRQSGGLRLIRYAPEGREAFIVGSVALPKKTPGPRTTQLMDKGGRKRIRFRLGKRGKATAKQKRAFKAKLAAGYDPGTRRGRIVSRVINYGARPYSEPALKAAIPKFPAIWKAQARR